MLSAKLTVVGGDAKAAEISLKLPTTIGRGRDVTLTLPHPLVSRQHCEIFERNGALYVRDLKSLNGTYVDSHRIDGTSELLPDQLLTIGTVTFRAQYSVASANGSISAGKDELEASTSQVLDINEPASADSDSKIDGLAESIHDKQTTPGRRAAKAPAVPQLSRETVRTGKTVRPTETESNTPVSSDVFDEVPASEQIPEHSVCAAMLKSAAATGKKPAPASLDEIRSLLPGVKAQAMASSIDGLKSDSNEAPLDDHDFKGVNVDETIRARVDSNDSALGSFIRKMPR